MHTLPISPAGPCRRRTRASSAILIGRTEPIVPYGTGRNRPRLLAGIHLRALTLTIRVRETCFSRPVVVLSGNTQTCVSAFGPFSACMYVCVCVRACVCTRCCLGEDWLTRCGYPNYLVCVLALLRYSFFLLLSFRVVRLGCTA